MKPEELMINDWVMADGTPTQILSLGSKGAIITGGFDKVCYYDNMQGILLTPEILEKNDFTFFNNLENNVVYKYLIDDIYLNFICITIINTTEFYYSYYSDDDNKVISLLPIHYIHELQHAFKLCGIDKEIVL